ncbi:glycosyltransferase family 4 protein [Acetatifactor aquisgranensis]|uniref:glycosyltransferase family 4 protein n=1 Tax=Acetatifactor aquisgranensis TaxID=2941233 RepID=UPI00203B55E7|nr:glycosyltransferase family 4 protein [Acetatifactor aquisgranensis]
MNKPNVLIVHNYYQVPGGEDTVVSNEKKMLESHGHKVWFYSRDNSELNQMPVMKKIALPLTMIFNPRTYIDIRKIIKEQKIGIVHVHNTLNLVSPSVYYAALSMNVPVVQTVHNFRLLCPGAMFYRDGHICEDCIKHGLSCAIKHRCYRNSCLQTLLCVISMKFHRMIGVYKKLNYICLTEFNRKKLLELKQINPEKVFVKPNFTFSIENEKVERDFYLYIGRIDETKGIPLLIEAFSRMPDKRLILAGTGVDLEYYREIVRNKGFLNIEFMGHAEKERLAELLKSAKAVVVASQWYEAFGMVIIEAFASHTPVIVGDIGNAGGLVDDGINGLKFQYDSSDSLVSIVEHFERQDIVTLGENAYQKYVKEFSHNKNYSDINAIYNDVRSGGGNGYLSLNDRKANQFMYVGRLEKQKGIDVLLQAWKQIEQVEFTQGKNTPNLIICGVGSMERWCRDYIQRNNLKTIRMMGYVTNEKVRRIMAESEALIFPTQCYEGFPMTIVEAYSVGIPVLGSDIGNTGSLIENTVTGLRFRPNDVPSIVWAVKWMLENKCDHITEHYNQHYSEEKNYMKMLCIYHKVKRVKCNDK